MIFSKNYVTPILWKRTTAKRVQPLLSLSLRSLAPTNFIVPNLALHHTFPIAISLDVVVMSTLNDVTALEVNQEGQ